MSKGKNRMHDREKLQTHFEVLDSKIAGGLRAPACGRQSCRKF